MKKNNMRLKGQLKLYMQWPFIMTILLVAMNVWVYTTNKRAGMVMSVCVVIYLVIACVLYLYNRASIFSDLIQFATQYGVVQNTLLEELPVPYVLVLEDGRIIWENDSFQELVGSKNQEKTLAKIIPELNRSIFPKSETENIEMEITYKERDYAIQLRKISIEGFSENEQLLEIPEEKEYFVAVSMTDVTELNMYVTENEEQRLIAGLIYVDNYDEVMDSVEEVRQSLLVALIDRKINQYIGNIDGIVKKLEKDKYFIVIKKKSYCKIQEDKFSLLEDVKNVNIGNARSATLSIGRREECEYRECTLCDIEYWSGT